MAVSAGFTQRVEGRWTILKVTEAITSPKGFLFCKLSTLRFWRCRGVAAPEGLSSQTSNYLSSRVKRPRKAGAGRVDTVDAPREGGAKAPTEPLYGVQKGVL